MDINAAGTPGKLVANDGQWAKFKDSKGRTHTMPTGQVRTLNGSQLRDITGTVEPPKPSTDDSDPFAEVQ